ncbi:DUF2059 domain-containing protein [Flavimaricola marinus]|uniref:Uncharacterized protein n=1 Tax=Flavimaricola marinus TaxID=1819565 RepID=A0A238LEE0_9RHOB|nr:DUF2059 domain-containing protein [Flavimaricola marinus]SMY07326.1 hypothetical protein LOM8899_01460 [Flavimaricola marinus]
MQYCLAAPILSTMMLATSLWAQDAEVAGPADMESVDALFHALSLPEMIEVMALEGKEYGTQIAEDLIPGGVSPEWTRMVASIYDTDRMEAQVQVAFQEALTGVDVDPILAFFEAEPGKTVVQLEVSARRALLDDAVEEASKEMAAIAAADETERFRLIDQYISINDLVETNVVGALNSNYAFYTGLAMGGAFPQSLTEEQILADVWSQEPQIRQNTSEWIYSFLLMAYQPLSDTDLEAYIAFSETEAGGALNRAVFAAFDEMFEEISRALGVTAGTMMITQDL